MLICSWRIWTTLLLTTGKDGSLALRKYLLSQRAARSCHAGNAQLAQGAQGCGDLLLVAYAISCACLNVAY